MRKWNLLLCAGVAVPVAVCLLACATGQALEPIPNPKAAFFEYPTETDANGRTIYKAPPVYGIPAPIGRDAPKGPVP